MPEHHAQSYSDLASSYDELRFSGKSGQFLFDVDRTIVVDWVRHAQARSVLDMPVGTGRTMHYLRDVDCRVTGLDFTPEMLAVARRAAVAGRHALVRGDASGAAFPDGAFDCLVSLRFFHLFRPAERGIFAREFDRVVRPGGHAIVSFTNGWYGGGIGWLKRVLGVDTVEFGYPYEVGALFPGWTVVDVRGNFLPMQWRLDRLPGAGAALRALTRHWPCNRLCWETFYLLRKPHIRS